MERVKIKDLSLKIMGEEDESSLEMYEDTLGEPFREGITMVFEDSQGFCSVFLERHEVEKIKEWLSNIMNK